MVEHGWGRIVKYSGASAYRGGGTLKAAVQLSIVGSPAGFARQFGKHGVTVNAMALSASQGERDPGIERDINISGINSKIPNPRFGQLQKAAGLVLVGSLSMRGAGFPLER